MEIIPKLNLNAHPKNVDNNSLVDGINLMLSDDGVIQTEKGGKYNTTIYNAIFAKYNKYFKILYCIECNIELVIFVQRIDIQADLSIFRFNEKEDKCIFIVDNFKYSGGNLTGVFTYNKNNLVIAISEYDDNNRLMIPLRVLNLGEFNNSLKYIDAAALYDNRLHPIKPEVTIPNISHSIKYGNAYKGWHHVFIRYKISNNTYTQWYSTNHSIFVSDYSNKQILQYKISPENSGDLNVNTTAFKQNVSDDSDICSYTYTLNINVPDNKFINYQIGIIIMSKDYTKCFYSDDLNIDIVNVDFTKFVEYSVNDILSTTYNYYNAKTIETYNNSVYIGNYSENNDNIKIDDIDISIGVCKELLQDKVIQNGEEQIYKYAKYNIDNNLEIDENWNTSNSKDIIATVRTLKDYNKTISYIQGVITLNSEDNIVNYISPNEREEIYLFFKLYTSNAWHDNDFTNPPPGPYYHYPYGYYVVKTYSPYCTLLNNPKNIWDYDNFCLMSRNNIARIWEKYLNGSITNGQHQYTINPDRDGAADGAFKMFVVTKEQLENDIKGYFPNVTNWNNIEHIAQGNIEAIESRYKADLNIGNWNWTYESENNEIVYTSDSIARTLNSFGVDLNEYYSFYIHFINKYGEISKGFQLNKFNIKLNNITNIEDDKKLSNVFIKEISNFKSDRLLYFSTNEGEDESFNDKLFFFDKAHQELITNYKIKLLFKLNKLPDDYVGYFVSYEQIENRIQYIGFGELSNNPNYNFNFYSDRLNIDDTINFNFNKIKYIWCNSTYDTNLFKYNTNNVNNLSLTDNNSYNTIEDKSLYVADTVSENKDSTKANIHSTKLFLKLDNTFDASVVTNKFYFCALYNNDYKSKYIKSNKTLIPCSQIQYSINDNTIINTKNSTISNIRYLYYQYDVIFNDANFTFIETNTSDNKVVLNPYYSLSVNFVEELPFQTIEFNNNPKKVVFPIDLGEEETMYNIGVIVELKNTIDLFKQNNLTYNKANLITLSYFNDNITNINLFPNTIRRSYPILDESYEISWRKFAPDVYKNIQENKGNIIKICNSGNILLVHTEYSLFMFDSNDSIKSVNDKIQLASIDIWDVNYKELFSSKLGFGGISKEHHSIIGSFGYIWFDSEHYNFYRLDGQMNMMKIDEDIINFIKQFKPTDVIFGNDIINSRVLIMLINNKDKIVLSYNTKSNAFISRHTYKYKDSYSTKNKIYLLDGSNQYLVNFIQNNNTVYEIINDVGNQMYSHIDIICKDNYENIKFLDAIQYKISKHSNVTDAIANDYLPVEGINGIKYAGDYIRIYSEYCDTDNLKILFDTIEEFNNPDVYVKPYWYLGNWHFNAIRNKLKSYIDDGTTIADEHSRVYGNYFVIRLIFNTTDCIKIESLSNSYKYM